MRTYAIYTFGCQMNEHDSEKMAGVLEEMGFRRARDGERPDLFIINSCAVREKSVQKFYTLIGRAKKWVRKGTVLGVTGCVVQLEREKLLRHFPHISFALGTGSYPLLKEAVERAFRGEKFSSFRWSRACWEVDHPVRELPSVAYVSIMEGCNNFCSYCVVPFTRGREKYRPFKSILEEVMRLDSEGYREVQLLGQNVNSWRDEEEGMSFPQLLQELASRVKNIKWIRFITSHPKDFTDELIDVMAQGEPISPYVHFPLQAGSDRILALMRRGYTAQRYIEIAERIRERVANSSIGTDIIVGFPTETEEDFERTLEVVRRLRFDNMYSFKYSPRPFSYAARFLKDDVPPDVKTRRLVQLQELQKKIQLEKNLSFIGKELEVLVVGRSKKDKQAYMGRDATYRVVNFRSEKDVMGKLVKVRITGAGPHSLMAEVVDV